MASPATDASAVTLILIGPDFVGVIKNDTGEPSFDLMSTLFLRDVSISIFNKVLVRDHVTKVAVCAFTWSFQNVVRWI